MARVTAIDSEKIFSRQHFSNYLFPPLKRSFNSLVRIVALVLMAKSKFKLLLFRKQIKMKESEARDLKLLDPPPQKFKVFSSHLKNEQRSLQSYFNIGRYDWSHLGK